MFLDRFGPACTAEFRDFEAVLGRNTIDAMEGVKILQSVPNLLRQYLVQDNLVTRSTALSGCYRRVCQEVFPDLEPSYIS